MSKLRPYQSKAVESVRSHWSAGVRAVCLVAPTGAGKTVMGEELVGGAGPVVWVAHRRELITQTAERLRARFGSSSVGVIMPGEYETPKARVQVATVQTLLARDARPMASTLVLDEAHHYVATDWYGVATEYPKANVVGLTATPERGDGEPLGDMFRALVVAASYSELVAGGFLVPVRVFRPAVRLGDDLAQDPFEAWVKHSEGSQAFVFCARVEIAKALSKRFRDGGVMAGTIEAKTPKAERDDLLARFRSGKLRVLTNVNTLTEGVDVPEARTVILARAFGHVGAYLQAVGRVLRPAKAKKDAILIDLTGASIAHGLPTDDREYALTGRAISGEGSFGGGGGERPDFSQEVRGMALEMVARGALSKGEKPDDVDVVKVDETERRGEYERLVSLAKQHRMRAGFAQAKYQEKFGEWPAEEWS